MWRGALLFSFLLASCFNILLAQSLTVDTANFLARSYGRSSDVSLPFQAAGCFAANNKFQLYLSDASGNFSSETLIGTYAADYASFVNGAIPTTASLGAAYRLRIKSTNPVLVSAPSAPFSVVASTGAVKAKTNPLSANRVLLTDVAFGWCKSPITTQSGFVLLNQSTGGATVKARLIDGITGAVDTNLIYASNQISLSLNRHFYTYMLVVEKDGVYSTRSYYLINSPNRLQLATDGEQQGCIPDTMQFQIGTDPVTGGIGENFPGIKYRVTWGDGVTDIYSYCELMSINGVIKHSYLATPCSQPGISYNVTISAILPWTNAPQGCENPQVLSKARIFKKPVAKFSFNDTTCVNKSVKFNNTSEPGQASFGNKCTINADFFWFINGIAVQQNMNTTIDKAALNYTFTTPGTHYIRLVVDNGSCETGEMIDSICVNPEPLPDFKIAGNDSITGCLPLSFTPTNHTNTPLCGINDYEWEVVDAITLTEIPAAPATFTAIPGIKAAAPSFTFHAPGRYIIRLKVNTAYCGTYVSADRYVNAMAPAQAILPASLAYCNPATIHFATDSNHKPIYNSAFGTETFNWTIEGTGGSFINGTNSASPYPSLQLPNYGNYNVRLVFTNGCGTDTAYQSISIDQPVSATILNGTTDTVCYSSVSIQLNGEPNGLVDSAIWSSTGTGTFSNVLSKNPVYTFSQADKDNGGVSFIYNAVPLAPSACAVATDTFKLFFYPVNTAADTTASICNGSQLDYTPSSTVGSSVFAWTASVLTGAPTGYTSSGTGNITSVLNNSSDTAQVIRYHITPSTTACDGVPFYLDVIVLPTPSFTIQKLAGDTICSGERAGISLVSSQNSLSFSWTSQLLSGSVTGNTSSGPKSVSTIEDSLANNAKDVGVVAYAITAHDASGCPGITLYDTVYIRPGVVQANAGADQLLCGQSTTTLTGNQPGETETGTWEQVSGPSSASFSATNTDTVIVASLSAGKYQFEWTINNGDCVAKKDTVSVIVFDAIVNNIDTSSIYTCSTTAITISALPASGGTGSYVYQWQLSKDSINWLNIADANASSYSFFADSSMYIRRLVSSGGCSEVSGILHINVAPLLKNNIIVASQQVCFNQAPLPLSGTLPQGGTGNFTYQWLESKDSINWTLVPGAIQQHYQPGLLNTTQWFRRIVSSGACTGPLSDTSNAVKLILNPPLSISLTTAAAKFCTPHLLDSADLVASASGQVLGYQWLVNGSVIGSGAAFPGYHLTTGADSLRIQLIATGNCNSDTASTTIFGMQSPALQFTLSDTVGCGPLTIAATNTTPGINKFTYAWDLGTGTLESTVQPGSFTLYPANNNVDTVYLIKLYSFDCDTVVATRAVLIKAKPKALFAPSKTSGCSPFTVTFNNNSVGSDNNYKWIFGDGASKVTATNTAVEHTYNTQVKDTFTVSLIAYNSCGSDTMQYKLVVSPNAVKLHVVTNGTDVSACAPHVVNFFNNSKGATAFNWNFGDGNVLTTHKNIDTITHLYTTPGTYTVSVFATNGCSDTSTSQAISVHRTPVAAFAANTASACVGDSIKFSNLSDTAASFKWLLGDGTSSYLTHPSHQYLVGGNYQPRLIASITYPSGLTCSDTSTTQSIVIKQKQQGYFSVSDSIGSCLPFTVTFTNQSTPSAFTVWNFGNGKKDTGDVVKHSFIGIGTFNVTMQAKHPGGCEYEYSRTIKTTSAATASLSYNAQPVCNGQQVSFNINVTNADSVRLHFGDGQSLVTKASFAYHVYNHNGYYLPWLEVLGNGCSFSVHGKDTIKVARLMAGFTTQQVNYCGYTTFTFIDTSLSSAGITGWNWKFAHLGVSTTAKPSLKFSSSNYYPVSLVVTSAAGCTDTITQNVWVKVNAVPDASIISDTVACSGSFIQFNAAVNSQDSLNFYSWSFGNGYTASTINPLVSFNTAGTFNATLVVGTLHGCHDTATRKIVIKPSPVVSSIADNIICKGQSVTLTTIGAASYQWFPAAGLSCTSCPSPVVKPMVNTTYVVTGKNAQGCTASDTVNITVVQPVQVSVSANDSICAGQSTVLGAGGAASYQWYPMTHAVQLSPASIKVAPLVTTNYRVVGQDAYGCFRDTAHVTVAVCDPLIVNLGQDKVLASGDKLTLNPVVTNGPVKAWRWYPGNNLSCDDCAAPVLTATTDVMYAVEATSIFGCIARDTVQVKVFCENAQVFVANAFTPDNDGVNDYLHVRGKGIRLVKSFRVFNRWGQVVFERANFAPDNSIGNAWDGRVNGKEAPPGVYIFTCEVVCDNQQPYIHKGNVTLLK